MFLPEAQLPAWVVCYVPGIMSILNIVPAPRSFPFIVPYLLFENTMSVTKFNAMISGLFRFGSSYEWIVTKKLGRSSEADLVAFAEKESDPLVEGSSLHRSSSDPGILELNKLEMTKKTGKTKRNRLYRKELALAFILLTASVRSLLSAQGIHFYFLLFQGITFLVVGLDLIGEQVSWPSYHYFSSFESSFPWIYTLGRKVKLTTAFKSNNQSGIIDTCYKIVVLGSQSKAIRFLIYCLSEEKDCYISFVLAETSMGLCKSFLSLKYRKQNLKLLVVVVAAAAVMAVAVAVAAERRGGETADSVLPVCLV